MTALASPAYVAEQIADELTLARLMGYRKLEPPSAGALNPTIWGIAADFKPDWPGADGRAWLPKWRRSWAAVGELIGVCKIGVSPGDVSASASYVDSEGALIHFRELHVYHPTADDAIRAAMCKAAIAYLTAQSKERGA